MVVFSISIVHASFLLSDAFSLEMSAGVGGLHRALWHSPTKTPAS
jgi:hypothetical protein